MNNVYDRMINMLLEARVEVLAEAKKLSPKQKKLDVNKSGKLDSQDFKMLRAGKRTDEASPMSRGDKADKISSKQVGAQPERVKQLAKRDPVNKALKTLDNSNASKKPHRVFTGRRMKTAPHIKTGTSKLKRAADTVRKHG